MQDSPEHGPPAKNRQKPSIISAVFRPSDSQSPPHPPSHRDDPVSLQQQAPFITRFSCVRILSHATALTCHRNRPMAPLCCPFGGGYTRNIFNRETVYRLPPRFLGQSILRKVLCSLTSNFTVLISKQHSLPQTGQCGISFSLSCESSL